MIRNKIKKILVTLDGSKNSFRGLDEAISIARACHATITGLYIIPIYPRNVTDAVIPYFIQPEKEARKFMKDAKVRAAQRGILFRSKITRGSPTCEIQQMAVPKKFDLLVIGARGRGFVKEAFLGSVSNAIVHKAKIPVMVVK
ncbi:MAG TPA: universal stress protein [Nitrosopumilaceae archaeon]|jgi:nucleotide-binding universal stress UspA family protein